MSSRDKILAAVAANQPQLTALPDISFLKGDGTGALEKFVNTLTAIGGKVIEISSLDDIVAHIKATTTLSHRVISTLSGLSEATEIINDSVVLPHTFQDVELTIINAHLGVAENGAVWIKDDLLNHRVLPFICQNLAIVLQKKEIVPTMHEAYEKIGLEKYGFGTFIAGPSKTADIEQSLVLGAHGSRTMTVFLV
ncbi:MAG: lutC 1 [Mucilaginibacter sp.]|nr:lutC 1 [Mucilaginibacter sp.]